MEVRWAGKARCGRVCELWVHVHSYGPEPSPCTGARVYVITWPTEKRGKIRVSINQSGKDMQEGVKQKGTMD